MGGFGRGGTGSHTKPKPGAATRRATTVPDQIIEEPTVNDVQPASDDLVDDWYAAHLDAAAKAEHAKQQEALLEAEGRRQRQAAETALNDAARLRGLLAKAERDAEQAALLAQGAEDEAAKWLAFQKRQQSRATGHAEKIDEQVAKGCQHPGERRQQSRRTGPQQMPPSALDGGPHVPLGPPPTQPFPPVGVDGMPLNQTAPSAEGAVL